MNRNCSTTVQYFTLIITLLHNAPERSSLRTYRYWYRRVQKYINAQLGKNGIDASMLKKNKKIMQHKLIQKNIFNVFFLFCFFNISLCKAD